jgi:hypothetical protein
MVNFGQVFFSESRFSTSPPPPVQTADAEVLVDRLKGKKILTLNRPKALNALNLSMVRKLYAELEVFLFYF